MKFRIHFTYPNGDDDSFIIEEETIEDIQEKAKDGVDYRGGLNPWSEEIK